MSASYPLLPFHLHTQWSELGPEEVLLEEAEDHGHEGDQHHAADRGVEEEVQEGGRFADGVDLFPWR